MATIFGEKINKITPASTPNIIENDDDSDDNGDNNYDDDYDDNDYYFYALTDTAYLWHGKDVAA